MSRDPDGGAVAVPTPPAGYKQRHLVPPSLPDSRHYPPSSLSARYEPFVARASSLEHSYAESLSYRTLALSLAFSHHIKSLLDYTGKMPAAPAEPPGVSLSCVSRETRT